MQTHEYAEAATGAAFDAAVRRLRGSPVESTRAALYAQAAAIVDELFCPCVTDAEDAAEGGRSSIHEGLISELLRRAGRRT